VFKDLKVLETQNGGFDIQITAACRQKSINFTWRGRIIGDATGEIRFEFDGEARSDFLRNRIGLCLLYPIVGCSGRKCVVEHSDGSSVRGSFPKLISPFQPFMNVRALRQRVTRDATVEVRFEGEKFEMEDQRNWTDASFKVYSTPLALPFPVRIQKGQRVRQAVTLRLISKRDVGRKLQGRLVRRSTGSTPAEVTVNFGLLRPGPNIGLGLPEANASHNAVVIERLRKLKLDHVRVDCRLWERDWARRFRRACKLAQSFGAGLHVAIFFEEEHGSELQRLGQLSRDLGAPVRLWLLFHRSEACTPAACIEQARELLEPVSRLAKFAAGTDGNFAELNRQRPPRDADWLPCCSMNPQIHAFDDLSLIENIAGQTDVVKTARTFSDQPLVVSPITLLPRTNANATETSQHADPRQPSLFAAGWTLGSLAELTGTRPVHSLTYYETVGPRGIMQARGSTQVFPVYHVFAGIFELTHLTQRRFSTSRAALQLAALAGLDKRGQAIIWLANLTKEAVEVRLKTDRRFETVRMKELNETNVAEASSLPENWWRGTLPCPLVASAPPLRLSPYAVARLELRQ
jgi:hypothetical protein